MSRKTLKIILLLVFVLAFALTAAAEMQSAKYLIPASVLSSGGTTVDSATYQMSVTIGQSSCIGQSLSGSYIIYAGFWQPETPPREGMFYIIPNKKGGAAVIYLE